MRVVAEEEKDPATKKTFFHPRFHHIFSKKNLTFQTVSPTVSPPKLNSWRRMQSQPQTTTRRQQK